MMEIDSFIKAISTSGRFRKAPIVKMGSVDSYDNEGKPYLTFFLASVGKPFDRSLEDLVKGCVDFYPEDEERSLFLERIYIRESPRIVMETTEKGEVLYIFRARFSAHAEVRDGA